MTLCWLYNTLVIGHRSCAQIVEQERKARDAGIHLDQPLPSIVGEEAAKEDLFQLDTRGDLNNLQFESMYKPPARRAWDPQGLARGPREPPSIASLRQERATVPSLEHATSGSRRLPHAFRSHDMLATGQIPSRVACSHHLHQAAESGCPVYHLG